MVGIYRLLYWLVHFSPCTLLKWQPPHNLNFKMTQNNYKTHWLHNSTVLSMIAYVGPKDRTLVDFWRLVWQERPLTIVMVTNIKEGNKVKCQQYWPDSGSKHFGHFKVTLVEYQVFADYVIRTLQVTVRHTIISYIQMNMVFLCS